MARNGSSDGGEEAMVLLEDVHLTLLSSAGAVNILRGLNLKVAAGETVGVVGPSGSGKSTMVSVIAGLEPANSGVVRVAGVDLAALDEDQLARFRRENLGIVFQSFHLVPTMTVLENVALPLELDGRRDAFARAEAELANVGLANRLGHYPAELSGGEQQRVALARAVAAEPRLLLADEPTGNLDRETGRQVIDLLFALQRQHGTTLVLITHDAAIAARCNRVVHLDDGQVSDAEPAPSGPESQLA